MKKIDIVSKQRTYSIIIKNNLLLEIKDYLDMDKFYVIISDNQIPNTYIDLVKNACKNNIYISFPVGETSKSFKQYERIISILQKHNIQRDACIIALGGGVTGDLAGFVASTYLRGIEYIQIPTSLLSQIDSSVGGKVAINAFETKNSVGAFYAPSKVLIDPTTLNTLSNRHFNNGMAEMIKYGMIYSKNLFNDILEKEIKSNLEYFIYESLLIKKYFVENDEFDNSIRQVLNYGHTFGHAIESFYNFNKYYHGEAVGLGMLKVCKDPKTKILLKKALNKFNLPIEDKVKDIDLFKFIKNDKKNIQNYLNLIVVDEVGKAYTKKLLSKEFFYEYNRS